MSKVGMTVGWAGRYKDYGPVNEQQKIYTTLLSQLVVGKWITGQEIQQFLAQFFFPKLGAG